MKKTLKRWNSETKQYDLIEAEMTDFRGTVLEVGQKVLYARANKSATSALEEAVISKLGDGYVMLAVPRTHWKYNPETRKGYDVVEDEQVRLIGTRGNYDAKPKATFRQLYVMP